MTNRVAKSNRGGFVMLLVLVMALLLFIMGIGLLALGSGARMQAAGTATSISARTAADAGLLDAVHLMSKKLKQHRGANQSWDNGWLPYESPDVNFADASYSFEITGSPSDGFQVTSTGKSGVSQKVVHGMLEVRSLWSGITVREAVRCANAAGFVTEPLGEEFVLRANSIEAGAVTLANGVVVPGDVAIGPNGDRDTVVVLMNDARITGQTYAALNEIVFPQINPPSGLPDKGAINIGGSDLVTIKNDGQYSSIIIGDSGVVRFECEEETGDPNIPIKIYVTGNVQLSGAGSLLITEHTTVIMYIGGRLELRENAQVNTEVKDATKLRIYGTDTCGPILFVGACDFYGAVYARNAAMRLDNTGDLYGAFAGRSLMMINPSTIYHYVAPLGFVDIDDDTASHFRPQNWWE